MREPFNDKTLSRPLFLGNATGGVENVELFQLLSQRLDNYGICHALDLEKIT